MASLTPTLLQLAKMTIGSPDQRARVQQRIDVLDNALGGRSMPLNGPGEPARLDNADFASAPRALHRVNVPDRAHLEKSRKMDLQMLEACRAPDFSGYTKNQLTKEYHALVDDVREGMLSNDQLRHGTDEGLVQGFLRHQQHKKVKMLALRNIHRILDPDDEVPILEVIRPTTATPLNYRDFLIGYDQVQWSDAQERALRRRELDDDTYQRFLLVKAKGIETPRLIQKLLDMDQALYEACQERFEEEMAALDLAEMEDEEPPEAAPAEAPTVPLSPKQKAIIEAYGQPIIDLIVDAPETGITLEEVQTALQLTTPKATLLLSGLVQMGMLSTDETTGRYVSVQ